MTASKAVSIKALAGNGHPLQKRERNEGISYHGEGRVKRNTEDSAAPRGGKQRPPGVARRGKAEDSIQNPRRAGAVGEGCPTGGVAVVGMKPKQQEGGEQKYPSLPSALGLLNHTRIWREWGPRWGSLQRLACWTQTQKGQRRGREGRQVIMQRPRKSLPGTHQATARGRRNVGWKC